MNIEINFNHPIKQFFEYAAQKLGIEVTFTDLPTSIISFKLRNDLITEPSAILFNMQELACKSIDIPRVNTILNAFIALPVYAASKLESFKLPEASSKTAAQIFESLPASMPEEVRAMLSQTHNEDTIQTLLDISEVKYTRKFTLRPKSEKPVYVTTPIYYVNAEPHVGHMYTTLLADAYTRWHKLRGEDTYFQTGTDEHGLKIQQVAEAVGLTPKAHCDKMAEAFIRDFGFFGFEYDRFFRTTDEDHIHACQVMWTRLAEAGYIYKDKYEGWYLVSDENFVTEKDTEVVTRDGKEVRVMKDGGKEVIWMSDENYMFRLSAFEDRLLNWFDEHKDWVYPEFRHNETRKFIASGLRDISISRSKDKLTWGIPVPGDDNHVMYVWIDALTNYLSGTGWPEKNTCWPADCQVLGKDIIRFHAVIWPAMLMAAEVELPKKLVVHGWWTKDGQKISKSLGNGFAPVDTAKEYGTDALKYYLLREANPSRDGDYSDAGLKARIASDLANSLGNMLRRTQAPNVNPSQSVLPFHQECVDGELAEVIEMTNGLAASVDHWMAVLHTMNACEEIWKVVFALNGMYQRYAPWKLLKEEDEESRKLYETVLHVGAEVMRVVFTILSAFMPEKSALALKQLGVSDDLINIESCYVGARPVGEKFGDCTEILFEKFE